MREKRECTEFQEKLDRLGGAQPGAEELAGLESHASTCDECAMILRMYLHIAGPAKEELEKSVPAEMADTMWRRIEPRTAGMPQHRPAGSARFPVLRRAFAPVLTAAVIVLVFAAGYMLGELRQYRKIESRMSSELERQERVIEALQRGRGGPSSDVSFGDYTGSFARSAFFEKEEYSVAELVSLLERLSPDTRLLGAREAASLIGRKSHRMWLPVGARLDLIDFTDGLVAGEVIILIETMDIDPATKISRDRLLSLRGDGTRM